MPQLVFTRVRYLSAALGTIAVGLWVHRGAAALSIDARDILGDALWAMMMTWFVGAAVPTTRLLARDLAAYGICAAVEFSQLIHTPAVDAVRETTLGGLVLGSGFDPRDLASYAMGVLAAALLEWTAVRSARHVSGGATSS